MHLHFLVGGLPGLASALLVSVGVDPDIVGREHLFPVDGHADGLHVDPAVLGDLAAQIEGLIGVEDAVDEAVRAIPVPVFFRGIDRFRGHILRDDGVGGHLNIGCVPADKTVSALHGGLGKLFQR